MAVARSNDHKIVLKLRDVLRDVEEEFRQRDQSVPTPTPSRSVNSDPFAPSETQSVDLPSTSRLFGALRVAFDLSPGQLVQAVELMAKDLNITTHKLSDGEWSEPMSMAEAARRTGILPVKKFHRLAAQRGLFQLSRKEWCFRLDTWDQNMRAALRAPVT